MRAAGQPSPQDMAPQQARNGPAVPIGPDATGYAALELALRVGDALLSAGMSAHDVVVLMLRITDAYRVGLANNVIEASIEKGLDRLALLLEGTLPQQLFAADKCLERDAFDSAALLQKHLAEMRHRVGKHVGLILFRYEVEDRVRQALGDPRHEVGDIRGIGLLDVLLHDVVDIAVKTVRHEIARW